VEFQHGGTKGAIPAQMVVSLRFTKHAVSLYSLIEQQPDQSVKLGWPAAALDQVQILLAEKMQGVIQAYSVNG
jgi:hypothetical protein